MRIKHIKMGKQPTPRLLKDMGLDDLYQKFVHENIEREKTKRILWIKNPKHYKRKAWKEIVWNWEEDLFEIRGETMFGKKEVFLKENLYHKL